MTADPCTIGVCGFGRCGSSMVMHMLATGGIDPVQGSQERSYEVADIDATWALPVDAFAGRAIKLLDLPTHVGLPPAGSWRFVWLDRDPLQQATSTLKLLIATGAIDRQDRYFRTNTEVRLRRLVDSYRTDRPKLLGALRAVGPVEVLQYERILANPAKAAKALSRVAPGFDRRAAAAVVHDRDGVCRQNLDFELGAA